MRPDFTATLDRDNFEQLLVELELSYADVRGDWELRPYNGSNYCVALRIAGRDGVLASPMRVGASLVVVLGDELGVQVADNAYVEGLGTSEYAILPGLTLSDEAKEALESEGRGVDG